ncbi:hypothetical protein ABIA39_000557 [Nocardia sp. GAS34]
MITSHDPGTETNGDDSRMSSETDRPGTAEITDDVAKADPAAASSDRYSVDDDGPKRSPALIATAVALPVALIIAVLIIAVFQGSHVTRDPLALGSVPQPASSGPGCTALLPALPAKLGDYTRSELAKPAPPATVAWQLPDGGDPIVLRCGLDRPAEFTKAAALQVVNGVNWFEVRDPASGNTSGTWYIVDRSTYIAVTMPDKAGPTPLQDLSNTVTKVLPAQPLDPGPIPS